MTMFTSSNFTIGYENKTQKFYLGTVFYNGYLTIDKPKARLLKHHIEKESLQTYIRDNFVSFLKEFRKLSFLKLAKFLESFQ